MPFVQKSNLPQNKVCLCAVGEAYGAIIHALHALHIDCVLIKHNASLPNPVACHADMQLCHLGGESVLLAPENAIVAAQLRQHGMQILFSDTIGSSYPEDTKLNALVLGAHCFANLHAIDKKITIYCNANQVKPIHINQGYAKCNVCIVDERSLITSDPSIAVAANNCGFDVLQITAGFIALDGYDTGFIGGCAGLIAQDLLAFTGTLQTHPDCTRIRNFLQSKSVRFLELTDRPLFDIGSILPLMEIGGQ